MHASKGTQKHSCPGGAMGQTCREEVRSSSRRLQAQGSLSANIIKQITIKQVSKMQRPKITASPSNTHWCAGRHGADLLIYLNNASLGVPCYGLPRSSLRSISSRCFTGYWGVDHRITNLSLHFPHSSAHFLDSDVHFPDSSLHSSASSPKA